MSYEKYIKKVCNFEYEDNINLYINPESDDLKIEEDTLALKICEENIDSDNDDYEDNSFHKLSRKCIFE